MRLRWPYRSPAEWRVRFFFSFFFIIWLGANVCGHVWSTLHLHACYPDLTKAQILCLTYANLPTVFFLNIYICIELNIETIKLICMDRVVRAGESLSLSYIYICVCMFNIHCICLYTANLAVVSQWKWIETFFLSIHLYIYILTHWIYINIHNSTVFAFQFGNIHSVGDEMNLSSFAIDYWLLLTNFIWLYMSFNTHIYIYYIPTHPYKANYNHILAKINYTLL